MFEEFYYWMTILLSKIETNDNPPHNAYFIIIFLQSFNIWTLFIFVNYFTKISFPENASIYIGVPLALVLGVINHYALWSC